MHGAEVSTAAVGKAGAIWVVLANDDLAMVSQGMAQFFPPPGGAWNDYYSLGKPDLVRFAQSLGADAYDVKSLDDMQHALAAAIEAGNLMGRPQVIVAHIDPTQVPPYYQDLNPQGATNGR
jgi:acetolactate synthase-1/2/3 large subunit